MFAKGEIANRSWRDFALAQNSEATNESECQGGDLNSRLPDGSGECRCSSSQTLGTHKHPGIFFQGFSFLSEERKEKAL